MAYLRWLKEEVRACCPLCGKEGPKGAVLATDHVLPGHPRVTLLRCPGCGAAFLQDLTVPDYETSMAEQLDYYVEQGAGIDCIVAPLLRLPPESVRRCLDVGCSFGFAIDFCRHTFGWEVLGVDPSPLAAAGAEALDLPIRRAYFSADLDLGPELFDLVLCSEILEHLAEPHALLTALRERLAPEGLLVLSTPNLAIVHRETEAGALGRALSPGLHLMLYDRSALSLVLAEAGFSEVRIEESPETLRAFAACSPSALERMRPAAPDRTLLRGYFAARAAGAPPGSALACGLAWRHFKECVNAGLYEEAAASRAVLARVYQARFGRGFGLDPERPAEAAPAGRRRPFNLTGALYFSGILELNGLGRPDRAADCFAAAVEVGNALLEEQRPSGLCDGETEDLTEQSRKHLPIARAAMDPHRAGREVEAVPPGPQGGGGPARRRGMAAGNGGERNMVTAVPGLGPAPGGPGRCLLMPDVSAILPVFNGRRFLRDAVRSVLAQSLPPCELIVVDDGSTDGSLTEMEGLPPAPFPIRVLRQANSGQSAARNLAARHAQGEYLAFLDQDDQWHPQHLEQLVAPLAADPAAGWAYCDFDEMDYDGHLVTRTFLRAHGVEHPKRTIFECVAADLMVLPSASVVRRTAFEEVGGFDEELSGYEDDDLFVRFFRLGWEHVFVDRALLRFRIHSNGSSTSRRFIDSRRRYAEKLVAILPDDPRMLRFYVLDAIAPRFFFNSLDDYVRACSARDWEGARRALEAVNHFARLRRRGLRLRWKLLWTQHPRLFRLLVALNDRLPYRTRFVRNPTVTLR